MPELRSAPQISTQSPSSYLAPGVHLLKPSRSEWNWNGVAHLRAKLGKNLRKRRNIQYNIYPPPRWFRMQLEPLRHSETLKNTFARQKDEKRQNTCKFQTVLTHMYMVCERWLSVLQKQGVLFFFFSAARGNVLVLYTQLLAIHRGRVLLLHWQAARPAGRVSIGHGKPK